MNVVRMVPSHSHMKLQPGIESQKCITHAYLKLCILVYITLFLYVPPQSSMLFAHPMSNNKVKVCQVTKLSTPQETTQYIAEIMRLVP